MPCILPILIAVALLKAGLFGQDASARAHADRAAGLAQKGDLKTAETELRTAVRLAPGDAELLTSLGGVLGMEGRLKEANGYLAKAVRLKPQDPVMLRNLAANEWQIGEFAAAHRRLDLLLQMNPDDKIATFLVCENEKHYARSIELLESVPEVIERKPEALVALASSYYHTNHPQDAQALLKKLLGVGARPQISFTAAHVAMDAHDYGTAEDLLSSVVSTFPDHAAVMAQLAAVEYRQGRTNAAEKTLLTALEGGYANQESYLLLSNILADHSQFEPALQYATEAARKFPQSYEILAAKGAIEMQLKNYSAAVATLAAAEKLQTSAVAERELAVAEWRSGDRARAVSAFEEMIRKYPRDAQICEVFGNLLLEDASPGSRKHAAEVFRRALSLDGSSVEAHLQLANVALEDGRNAEALEHIQLALRSARDDSRLHFTLSRIYRRQGRDADADRELNEYRRLKK